MLQLVPDNTATCCFCFVSYAAVDVELLTEKGADVNHVCNPSYPQMTEPELRTPEEQLQVLRLAFNLLITSCNALAVYVRCTFKGLRSLFSIHQQELITFCAAEQTKEL